MTEQTVHYVSEAIAIAVAWAAAYHLQRNAYLRGRKDAVLGLGEVLIECDDPALVEFGKALIRSRIAR